MKFYPADWRSEPRLRVCSLAARGLWMEMLCLMHEAEPYGHLFVGGKPVTVKDLATLAGITLKECSKCLAELEQAGVYSVEQDVIISRRMVRDAAKEERDKANGKAGGNPSLKGGVNPQDNGEDKAQILEARDQKERKKDAAKAALKVVPRDQDADLFERGKQVLGESAGGLIAKLKHHYGGSVAKTRAAIEQASERQNPREYVGGILRGPPDDGYRPQRGAIV